MVKSPAGVFFFFTKLLSLKHVPVLLDSFVAIRISIHFVICFYVCGMIESRAQLFGSCMLLVDSPCLHVSMYVFESLAR